MSAETDSQSLPLGWIEPLVTVPVGIPAPRAHRDDAELVRTADLAAVYDRYGDALFRFALGLLRDREAAADCVQEVFHTAATRLHQLRDPSALRAWLYAIARHDVSRRRRADRRELVTDDLPDRPGPAPDPSTHASRRELAELVGDASRGLPDRDRAALALHYHQELDGPEVAAALGLSLTNTTTLLNRARATFERSLAALLLARRARAGRSRCPELTALVARWDGEVTVLWRKRTARHIDLCPTCTADRADAVNPRTLLGATPVLLPTPRWLRAASLQHVAAAVPARSTRAWWPPAARAGVFAGLSSGSAALAFAAAVPVAGLLAAGGAPLVTEVGGGPVTEQPSAPRPGGGGAAPSQPPPRFGFDMPTFAVPPPPGAAPVPAPAPLSVAPPAASNGRVFPTTGAPPPPRPSFVPYPTITLAPDPGEDPRSAEPTQPSMAPTLAPSPEN
ncbi:RNA polymerase sigma factor [Actinomycetospora soli]|uniref:RNA polymerase sigma factor n=1 Tax=Actinomycetospora soli TaxID=2893887 RepID=UPI001E52F11A|nr:sigma-70 family RNA polymerase sigma factor [Actinomycetospora soli]MCD2187798.1 sigma-70 family RNA polymerase sigma factor [Actinomycetospora soli]